MKSQILTGLLLIAGCVGPKDNAQRNLEMSESMMKLENKLILIDGKWYPFQRYQTPLERYNYLKSQIYMSRYGRYSHLGVPMTFYQQPTVQFD